MGFMSDPTYGENLKKWLLENYPVEAVFMDEIVKTVNEMCQRGGLGKNLKDNEVKDIKIQIRKRPGTDYAELEMSTPALLFTIGMARAISNFYGKYNKQNPLKRFYLCP